MHEDPYCLLPCVIHPIRPLSPKVLAGLVTASRALYRVAEIMVVEGWEHALPSFLRQKRPKIFLADDPVPGTMNKTFRLEVDPR